MSKNAFSLDGKVIVITGAAGGIGMEVCRQLGGDGAKLIMADIDEV
ncbi:MAG: SDR family NAD(P)-dependent oxidoreductase, partial [Actinobacteria bacterium]|nr:SDR family NAD(P)-dependent oxidoreductase [Actinomycetota bacterium]